MDTRAIFVTIGFAVALMASTVKAGQQPVAGDAQGTAQVAQCRQAQAVVTTTIEGALKRLEEARLTNSPAVMRAAADDLQAAFLEIRMQLAPCAQIQASAPEGHAGHTMPSVQQAPSSASESPAIKPGAAAPGAGAGAPPTPAPGADPHAGHVKPGTQQAPARPVPQPSQKPGASGGTLPRPQNAPTAGTSGEHPGHAMPAAPAATTTKDASRPTASEPRSAAKTTAANPATDSKDLVCENVDPKTAPRMLYQGRMYYFCSEGDRAEFAKSPDKYVKAPSTEKAPAHAH